MTERQNFEVLQKKMQIPKSKKGDVKYAFRNAEEIETHFKKVSDGWTLTFEDEIVELGGRLFYYANVLVQNKEKERYSSRGIAELGDVPVLTTKTGKVIQQMQVPQWTGAVGSYARKYALQGVFAIGEEDVDSFPSDQNLTENNQKKVKTKVQKIAPAVATGYEAALKSVAEKNGSDIAVITSWFLGKLKVHKLEDITEDQVTEASGYIERLQKGKEE